MKNDSVLIAEIDGLLSDLRTPIDGAERQDGWTDESRVSAISFLENIREKIVRKETLSPMNLARALDSWGVISGQLLDRFAELSNNLRER